MIILEPMDCGSARSRASRRTGRTSNEYVVAMRKPMIRVLYMRPCRLPLDPAGRLVVADSVVLVVLLAFSSSTVSIT